MNTNEITAAEAARRAGVSLRTVSRWIAEGRVPARQDGRRVMLPADSLPTMGDRTCPKCGATFTPTADRQKFCSDKCRKADVYERWKAAHPAARGPGKPPQVPAAPAGPIPERLQAALEHVRNPKA